MKVGKKILSQDIDRTQVAKLLTNKKTDLLTAFVSMRTRRKFSAYLAMAADGKTSFEFEPRKEGAGKKFGKKPFGKKADGEGDGEANGTRLKRKPSPPAKPPLFPKPAVPPARRSLSRRPRSRSRVPPSNSAGR